MVEKKNRKIEEISVLGRRIKYGLSFVGILFVVGILLGVNPASADVWGIPNGDFEAGWYVGPGSPSGYHDIPNYWSLLYGNQYSSGGADYPLTNIEQISGHGNVLYVDTPNPGSMMYDSSIVELYSATIELPSNSNNIKASFEAAKNDNGGDINWLYFFIADKNKNYLGGDEYWQIYADTPWTTYSTGSLSSWKGQEVKLCLQVGGFGEFCAFLYLDNFKITYAENDADTSSDAGDSYSSASPIVGHGDYSGDVNNMDDTDDYYKAWYNYDDVIDIDLLISNGGEYDTNFDLMLYNPYGGLVASSTNDGNNPESITVVADVQGYWVIQVYCNLDYSKYPFTTTYTLSIYDNNGPSAPVPDDGIDGWSNDNTPTFSWNEPSDMSGIEGYFWCVDGGQETWTDSTSVTLPPQPDGIHTFYVRAKDNVGNVGDYGSHDFYIDTVPPVSPSPNDGVSGWSNDNTPTFTWNVPSDMSGIAGYHWKVDGSQWWWTTATSVTISEQPDGSHTFYVKATDNAGNMGSEGSHNFKIDTIVGEPSPDDGVDGWSNDNTPTFSWTTPYEWD
jgi:hypothetical protein